MRGGYVGLMNCVFAAQKAVRLSPFSASYIPSFLDQHSFSPGSYL